MRKVFSISIAPLKAHKNRYGGRFHAIILGIVWVVSFGQQVGATPDGRKAGRPLAHGLSPQSVSAAKGITEAIHSVTRLSLHEVGGGGATMWNLGAAWATLEVLLLSDFSSLTLHTPLRS